MLSTSTCLNTCSQELLKLAFIDILNIRYWFPSLGEYDQNIDRVFVRIGRVTEITSRSYHSTYAKAFSLHNAVVVIMKNETMCKRCRFQRYRNSIA